MTESLRERVALARYPRSGSYDPQWMIDNTMGPNPLWLLEWLADALDLRPGMRVLDLGCGRAMTSVFLAREFGAQVTAADLWVKPGENWPRIQAAGCAHTVLPLLAEAHDLPFAEGYFDAIVSVDAYQYFGTNDLYVGYISRFLRPGGQIGIVVPALTREIDGIPETLRDYWEWDFLAFHSPAWWRSRWALSGKVEVTAADWLDDGWRDWLLWSEVCAERSDREFIRNGSVRAVAMLSLDMGRTLGFARVVARAPAAEPASAGG